MTVYYSHTESTKDIHTGLIGPIIITHPNYITSANNYIPCNIDKEFFMFFMITNELNSHLLMKYNIFRMTNFHTPRKFANITYLVTDPDFKEINIMRNINGYMFGFHPGLFMEKGKKIRFYLFSFGSFLNFHNLHGHDVNVTFDVLDQRKDMIDDTPVEFEVMDMVANSVGTWIFKSNNVEHADKGMSSIYTVTEERI